MPDVANERHELEAAALTLREQERLGRQLHDTLGPQITAISMLANSLYERLQARAAEETALAAKILDRIEQAKVDVRALAKGLMPVEVDAEGLMSALAELADETAATFAVACHFECDRPVAIHDNFTATRLYRIAKEAVHNAIKHAQPTELVIRLCERGSLVLEVRDDGIGFSRPLEEISGNGIRIMRHRCRLIGGSLDVYAGPDGGTVVTCSIQQQENRDV